MKKGFTLIELLAVLVIISIIGALAMPNITKLMNQYKKTLRDTQIKNIEAAARDWGAKNLYFLPTGSDINVIKRYEDIEDENNTEYGVLVITLGLLQETGYIKGDINNPETKENFDKNLEIYITNLENGYNYEVKMG